MSVGKSAASRKRSSSGLGRLLRQGGNGFGRTRYFVQSLPVVLAPCPSNTGGGRAMSSAQYTRASPMLKIRWDRNNEQSNEQLEFIEYAGVQLEALDLRLEERMLQHLYKFVVQCSSIFVAQEHGAADTAPVRVPGEAVERAPAAVAFGAMIPAAIRDQSDLALKYLRLNVQSPRRVYIAHLELSQIHITFSFLKAKVGQGQNAQAANGFVAHEDTSTNEYMADDEGTRRAGGSGALSALRNFALNVASEVRNSPITFPALEKHDLFVDWAGVFELLGKTYMDNIVIRLASTLFSVEFLGNPMMLTKAVMRGVSDFVLLPITSMRL